MQDQFFVFKRVLAIFWKRLFTESVVRGHSDPFYDTVHVGFNTFNEAVRYIDYRKKKKKTKPPVWYVD